MNYLLVMPRFVDTVGEWYHFPLGIPYVSSSMKQSGLRVFTLNMNSREGVTREIIAEEIRAHSIDVVLTGGLSFQYPAIREILQAAKELNPRIVTVAGGGIITSAPVAGMEVLEFADYGIVGEGEEMTPALCHALERGEDVMAVEGIVYRDDGVWMRTKARKEVADLDAIPFPDYDGFDFSKIAAMVPSLLGMNEDHAITMTTSRSCPFQCTFCFHTSGSHYRKRSLDNFFEELDLLVEKYHIKYIFVNVRFFTRNVLTCKKCGKRHKLPILPEVVRYITSSVEILREECGKIAFWGINDYFATMIPDLPFVGAEGVFLIDNSKIKQGSEVDGHLIHSPEILDAEEIDTVVVPVVSLMSTIEKQIHQAFPRVKNVINILDLVKPTDEKCVG